LAAKPAGTPFIPVIIPTRWRYSKSQLARRYCQTPLGARTIIWLVIIIWADLYGI
jgi:hypothetical protein